MDRYIITILISVVMLLGCSSQQIDNDQPSNSTAAKQSTILKVVPAPDFITIYSDGKSKVIQPNNTQYLTLANQIEAVLASSNLSSTDMYKLAIPQDGDISDYKKHSGVELVYNTSFSLTTRTRKPSVFRLFIFCSEKPMLFIGIKKTDDYSGSGLGPLVISNTNDLKQLVSIMIKQD